MPPEVEASYAAIIDTVLAGADLQTISAKRIRKELAARVGYDINPQKVRLNPRLDSSHIVTSSRRMKSID